MQSSLAALRDAKPLWRDHQARAVLPLLLLVTLTGTGSAMVTTIVSLALSKPGVTPLAVQAVLMAYPTGFLAGCLVARRFVAHYGHERSFALIFALITAVAALSSAGFMVTEAKPAWFALRLAGGLAMTLMFVVCESWMNLYAQAHNRGRLFSLCMLATATAALCGQLVLAAIGPASGDGFAIPAAIVLAAVLGKIAVGPG